MASKLRKCRRSVLRNAALLYKILTANQQIYIFYSISCKRLRSSMSEVAGARTKGQGQRDTTHQNLFQQNDPSQHLPTALQPALHKQLTSGCRQGDTHRSHQCASLHILAWTRVTASFFSSPIQNVVLSRYLEDLKLDFIYSLIRFIPFHCSGWRGFLLSGRKASSQQNQIPVCSLLFEPIHR